MLAIAFDLVVAEVDRLHPRSVRAAYADIGRVMSKHGYRWIQEAYTWAATATSER